MKIILNLNDIKTLIKEKYSVKDSDIICENDDIEITLNVDSIEILTKQKIPDQVFVPKGMDVIPVDEDVKQESEAKQGSMASGGSRRNVVNIG